MTFLSTLRNFPRAFSGVATLLLTSALHAEKAPPPIRAEHVVLVVWDGMRPDFVRPDTTPVLHALATRGTFFNKNHAVYITSTEVNGAAIATGCYPNRTNILANVEFRPDIQPFRPVPTENSESCRIGDNLTNGKYIGVPTLAELIQQAGFQTAIAGTKPVALLHDRSINRSNSLDSVVIFAGKSSPDSAIIPINTTLGKFPASSTPPVITTTGSASSSAPIAPTNQTPKPNTLQNAWTTRVLTEELWRQSVPRFSTLWLSDPDSSQHLTQPGSDVALAGIRNSDNALGSVISALKAKGVFEKTAIFVVSDHGFSTTDQGMNLGTRLKKAGFTIVRGYHQKPKPGEILQVSLGGSFAFYVPDHDPEWTQKLATFLQSMEFSGPIFTRLGLPGTFPLSAARIDAPHSPDLIFSSRWTNEENLHGTKGLFFSEGQMGGGGTHGSLSPNDVHNTLIAAGPGIRVGFLDNLPTANVDVAPTILHLLGIAQTSRMDGRILQEALTVAPLPELVPVTKIIEATTPTWRQYLTITTLGESTYLDEGNASPIPQK